MAGVSLGEKLMLLFVFFTTLSFSLTMTDASMLGGVGKIRDADQETQKILDSVCVCQLDILLILVMLFLFVHGRLDMQIQCK